MRLGRSPNRTRENQPRINDGACLSHAAEHAEAMRKSEVGARECGIYGR